MPNFNNSPAPNNQRRRRRRLVANQGVRPAALPEVSVLEDNELLSYEPNGFKITADKLILNNGYKDLAIINHKVITQEDLDKASKKSKDFLKNNEINLEAVFNDLTEKELINVKPHRRGDVDWREVLYMRFGTHVLKTDRSDMIRLTW